MSIKIFFIVLQCDTTCTQSVQKDDTNIFIRYNLKFNIAKNVLT